MRPLILAMTAALTTFPAALCAAPALAQVAPVYQPPLYRPGAPVAAQHQYQLDQHRYRIDQLRYEADRRQLLADQMALDARIRRNALEAARAPQPAMPGTAPYSGGRRLYAPEVEAGLARGATSRREAVVSGVTQIDSWLDRTPD